MRTPTKDEAAAAFWFWLINKNRPRGVDLPAYVDQLNGRNPEAQIDLDVLAYGAEILNRWDLITSPIYEPGSPAGRRLERLYNKTGVVTAQIEQNEDPPRVLLAALVERAGPLFPSVPPIGLERATEPATVAWAAYDFYTGLAGNKTHPWIPHLLDQFGPPPDGFRRPEGVNPVSFYMELLGKYNDRLGKYNDLSPTARINLARYLHRETEENGLSISSPVVFALGLNRFNEATTAWAFGLAR
jgi:hypothetical protein